MHNLVSSERLSVDNCARLRENLSSKSLFFGPADGEKIVQGKIMMQFNFGVTKSGMRWGLIADLVQKTEGEFNQSLKQQKYVLQFFLCQPFVVFVQCISLIFQFYLPIFLSS